MNAFRTDLALWAARVFVLLVACVTFGEMTDIACGDVAGHGTHAEARADVGAGRDIAESSALVALPSVAAQPPEPVAAEPVVAAEPESAPAFVAEWPPGRRLARDGIPLV